MCCLQASINRKKENIHVLSSDLNKWKITFMWLSSDLSKWKKKHPRVFFRLKQIERQKTPMCCLQT